MDSPCTRLSVRRLVEFSLRAGDLTPANAAAMYAGMLGHKARQQQSSAETERAVLSALKRVAENRTVISISHRTSAELGRIIALTD